MTYDNIKSYKKPELLFSLVHTFLEKPQRGGVCGVSYIPPPATHLSRLRVKQLWFISRNNDIIFTKHDIHTEIDLKSSKKSWISLSTKKKLYYILVSSISGKVRKTASWKTKSESNFPNHDTLIRTLEKICIWCQKHLMTILIILGFSCDTQTDHGEPFSYIFHENNTMDELTSK